MVQSWNIQRNSNNRAQKTAAATTNTFFPRQQQYTLSPTGAN